MALSVTAPRGTGLANLLAAAIMLVAPFPGGSSTVSAGKTTNTSRLAGVALSKKSIILKRQIESQYRAPLRCETSPNFPQGRYAESDVASDGTPVVRLAHSTKVTESIIVHELMHLKLFGSGYPYAFIWDWSGLLEAKTPDNESYMEGVLYSSLFADLTHFIFYKDMWAAKLRPDEQLCEELDTIFKSNGKNGFLPGPHLDQRVVWYLKYALLVRSETLRAKLDQLYAKNQWFAELSLGRSLVAEFLADSPNDPEELMTAFIKIANRVQEVVTLKFRGWQSIRRGRTDLPAAVVSILPRSSP